MEKEAKSWKIENIPLAWLESMRDKAMEEGEG